MRTLLANSHSRWLPLSQMRQAIPKQWLFWLQDAESLTQRLKTLSRGHFTVELLSHGHGRPFRDERCLLKLDESAHALIRQVRLLCHGQPVVFARTVIPVTSLSGKYRLLSRLGTRPLGELLFSDKTMWRGEVEVAEYSVHHRLFCGLAIEGTDEVASIWGRRSLFYLANKPLLVSEFFLPRVLDFHMKAEG